ncbi:hypothetical protein HPP05_14250 [Corallococcus exiguus]|uniref:hypothetical protein n=1 Tax=Corallococcus exiguus TaxID=83462 RepID=UPI001493FC64|nr:hypothetical protein [Corallococcus exiguus]NPC70912.1 hypothetical protein [Corallococcus exiguus]
MGSLKLSLEAGAPKRLELTWGLFWKNFEVRFDGRPIGSAPDAAALKAGVEYRLPDGSTLQVKLKQTLSVLRDGVPVPGSDGDPEQQMRSAGNLLYFLAALNGVLGVLGMVLTNDVLEQLGMGFGAVLFGAVLGVLGVFTHRRTRWAPAVAIGLYVLDSLLTFIDAAEAGTRPTGGLLMRAFIIFTLYRAFKASGTPAPSAQGGPGVSPQM